MPRKVPLLVADAMVSLRNAIEHTLFAEVEHRDGELDERAAKLVEMPAVQTYQAFAEWVKRRAKNGPPSLRQGSDLLKRIDNLQPLHRTKEPQNHPMALLALHTNHSKHRAPAITAVRLAAAYREDQMPRSMGDLERRPEVPLHVGDVIAETPEGTQIPMTLFPTIGINRPGTDRWPVLIDELKELAMWVRTQAIPRLITGIEPPSPALPTRYEITIGHDDERSALSAGSTVSAAQLYSERISAASARIDLVEIIGQMEHAPSVEQIEAWLESLPDQEILARVRQLKPSHTYAPDIRLAIFAALEAMRDDARRFAGLDVPADEQALP